jgi:hypothetical protein
MTLGNAFGLSLYAGNGAGRRPAPKTDSPAPQKSNEIHQPDEPALSSGTSPDREATPSSAPSPKHSASEPARQERIDKSSLTLAEPARLRDPDHLKFVVRHGCVICGKNRTQAHHLTFAQPNAMGRKVSDEFTVPLCATHHSELHHAGNEPDWWKEKGVDAMGIARELWESAHQDMGKSTGGGIGRRSSKDDDSSGST